MKNSRGGSFGTRNNNRPSFGKGSGDGAGKKFSRPVRSASPSGERSFAKPRTGLGARPTTRFTADSKSPRAPFRGARTGSFGARTSTRPAGASKWNGSVNSSKFVGRGEVRVGSGAPAARPNGKRFPKKPSKTFTPPLRKAITLPPSTLPEGFERLEKYLATAGLASRREAKDLIKRGFVLVNGKKIYEPGFGVKPLTDTVVLDNKNLPTKESIVLYKPRGIETTATSDGSVDIKTRFPKFAHLSPIGRLDKDSQGLIILSTDGTLARLLTEQNSPVEKEYLVTVREEVTPEHINRLTHGILLDGIQTKPAIVKRSGRTGFTIILHEGRKHQIRRMCDACHLTVTSLIRIRIGHIEARKMLPGMFRVLNDKDIQTLKNSKLA